MPRSGLHFVAARQKRGSSTRHSGSIWCRVISCRSHASAAMDISDGLVGDFGKLCRASGVAADINVASVPVSDAAKTVIAGEAAALELALTGGDDYEIICTVPNKKAEDFRSAARGAGVPVTELGGIKTGEGARFIDAAGKPLVFKRASFSHF